MQEVTGKINSNNSNTKCPECRGKGELWKRWPTNVIGMPHELTLQKFQCWRCKGTGFLQLDDMVFNNSKKS